MDIRITTAVRRRAGSVHVEGHTSPGAAVTVNGAPVRVGPDGRFALDVPVSRGQNTVLAKVVDGKSSTVATASISA